MGLLDKVKGLVKGREQQVKSGIDTVSDKVEQKVGPEHAGKVDAASDKAKEAVDKLAGNDAPASAPPETPPAPSPPTPPAPPAT
jgi:phage terminase small subunit